MPYDPNQPRDPGGVGGGQWIKTSGSSAENKELLKKIEAAEEEIKSLNARIDRAMANSNQEYARAARLILVKQRIPLENKIRRWKQKLGIATDGTPLQDGVDPMDFLDAVNIVDGSIRKTEDGYLTAFARVARTGIQIYKGYEVGKPDLDEVRVYRPEAEVFSNDAMHSFAHRPMTLNHPPDMVDADNWKDFAVGATGGEVVRDGEFIRVPLVLMDAKAIRRVEKDGLRELSMGYSTELKWSSGFTKDGAPYDAIQTAIRANHLAVVANARGGPDLKIGDTHRKEIVMTTRTMTIDGVPVEISDRDAAVVQRAIDNANKRARDAEAETEEEKKKREAAEKARAEAEAKAKKDSEAKDGEIAALKKKVEDSIVTPQKLDEMVKARGEVIDRACFIAGDALPIEGKSNDDIRRAAVAAKLGDDISKAMSDAAIEGAFVTLASDYKPGATRSVDAMARSFSAPRRATADARETAYEEQGKKMRDAWRNPQTVATQ